MVNKLINNEFNDDADNKRYPSKIVPERREPTIYGQQPGSSVQARPWRQWHTAASTQTTAALEVAQPRKPQWGRWMYFAILLGIAYIAMRFVYLNFFWFSADGVINGTQYNVAPSDTVSIKEILVSPSDTVEEGQLLATLSSPALVQSLAKNEADIARLQSDLEQRSVTSSGNESQLTAQLSSLQAEMEYLESQYFQETQQLNALRELVDAGASQRGNLDQLQNQHNKTWAEYRRVEAELASTRSQLAGLRNSRGPSDAPELSERLAALTQLRTSIEDQLAALELRAPKAGTVARVPVSQGDVLRAGEPAVEIVDKNQLRAYLYFPPAAQEKLKKDMVISVSRADGSQFELVVNKVYPSMSALPDALQQGYRPNSSAIVVEAYLKDGKAFEMDMTSGTPIEGRIPRWSLPANLGEQLERIAGRSADASPTKPGPASSLEKPKAAKLLSLADEG
ncbi:secretion protein HlyD family protein [gamma proteobacterium BDW918]|jgi:multidrug resistance efflux pump|uniref:Uncharacterized protein n=1 Tax=Zhongshania aliphaticivorans TaxID=1470434 RepID=A0A127M677_9GAMM|nr:HlyD family secretion protein [Zhongshania aliphaticivorans]AMO68738.1 hypothetical protein AZF00_10725 [Zhongshania aliphaticivorans]EIF43326.1 secretion protein HlyD family protein [gamma proteobacterium BDW918]